jgi:exosortase
MSNHPSVPAPTTNRFAISWPVLLPALAIAAISFLLFGWVAYAAGYNEIRRPILELASGLWKLEDWQHCFLVPIAAGFIIYLDRKKLAALPILGTWAGLPVIALGLAFYWFGYLADIVYLGYISAQLILAGLILLFFGWAWMRALAFPWLFLGFMWPLLFLDNLLAFPLRGVMSKASVLVLNGIGVASTLSGTAILSAPDPMVGRPIGKLFSVDVADPCSGIRSLFALMMVSALYGHFALKGWWKKWILFGASIPLAVVGNLFRILMLTFGTIAMGAETAIGTLENPSFFHMLSGYLVFAVAIGGMLGVAKLLNFDWKNAASSLPKIQPPKSTRQVENRQIPGEDAY